VRIAVISAGNPKIRNLGHRFIVDLVGLEARDKYVLTLNVPVDDRWLKPTGQRSKLCERQRQSSR
jgi:hypothetical protein